MLAALVLLLGQAAGGAAGQAPEAPLSKEAVAQILRPVPVFVATDDAGKPVTAQREGKSFVGVFVGKAEGETFVARLKTRPGFEKVRLSTVALDAVADLGAAEAQFVPIPKEVGKALAIVQAEKPEVKEFPGVPVFFLTSPDGGYMTVTAENRTVIPLFFSWDQAEDMRLRAELGGKVTGLKMRVTALEQVLVALRQGPASQTRQFALVPHRDSVAAIEKEG